MNLSGIRIPPLKASRHSTRRVVSSLSGNDGPQVSSPADLEDILLMSSRADRLMNSTSTRIDDTMRLLRQYEGMSDGPEGKGEIADQSHVVPKDDTSSKQPDHKSEALWTTKSPASVSTLLHMPNANVGAVSLSQEQQEMLIDLHVKPFQNPHTFDYSATTGAYKHGEHRGVWFQTSYTPDINNLITSTGACKGGWQTGVDPDTHYAGDVMMFPAVECVHKNFILDSIVIAMCDEPDARVDAGTQTDGETYSQLPGDPARPETLLRRLPNSEGSFALENPPL
jgi:hypothetical protein